MLPLLPGVTEAGNAGGGRKADTYQENEASVTTVTGVTVVTGDGELTP